MRVAVLSYPMLFQTLGGLRMKVTKTVEALNKLGIEAKLFDTINESLTNYDVVHIFAAYNGNHRIIQHAKAFGLPTVLSPILTEPWSKLDTYKAKILSRVAGKIMHWKLSTSFDQTSISLNNADHLIVLGNREYQVVTQGYGIHPIKVTTIPNGIDSRFFEACPKLFDEYFKIPHPFVLHSGMLGEQKNQLGLIQALKNENIHIVLIGESNHSSQAYLTKCLYEGGNKVHYLGVFEHGDPMLVSAYAAADVVAIPSQYEGMPNSIFEALAAGTPVVLTNKNSINTPLPSDIAIEVSSFSKEEIHNAVANLLKKPPEAIKCRQVVKSLTWNAVATQLESIYLTTIKKTTATRHESSSPQKR